MTLDYIKTSFSTEVQGHLSHRDALASMQFLLLHKKKIKNTSLKVFPAAFLLISYVASLRYHSSTCPRSVLSIVWSANMTPSLISLILPDWWQREDNIHFGSSARWLKKKKKKRSTLCITCRSQFKLPLLDILCVSKVWHFQCSVSAWGDLLPAFDHLEMFLTSSVLTAVVLRFFLSWGRFRKSQHSVCQKWSKNQMLCYKSLFLCITLRKWS